MIVKTVLHVKEGIPFDMCHCSWKKYVEKITSVILLFVVFEIRNVPTAMHGFRQYIIN
jgi:hypothetical protein